MSVTLGTALATSCAGELDETPVDGANEGGETPSVYTDVYTESYSIDFRTPNSLGQPASGGARSFTNATPEPASGGAGTDDDDADDNGIPAGECGSIPPACSSKNLKPLDILSDPLICGGSICHGTAMVEPVAHFNLGYEQDGLMARLATTAGTGTGDDGCDGFALVDATNPDASLILDKIIRGEDVACGDPMPPVGYEINEDQTDCLVAWVRQDAVACGPFASDDAADNETADDETADDETANDETADE